MYLWRIVAQELTAVLVLFVKNLKLQLKQLIQYEMFVNPSKDLSYFRTHRSTGCFFKTSKK